MKLNDAFLTNLNSLVTPKDLFVTSASYANNVSNMKLLSAELRNSAIHGSDLDMGVETKEPSHDIKGHLLLHSGEILDEDWNDTLIRLQEGSHKNAGVDTLFGNLDDEAAYQRCVEAIGNTKLADQLRSSQNGVDAVNEPASIAERVVFCLKLITVLGVYSPKPAVTRAAQRLLSETLLNFPVLMHPKILVPMFKKGVNEYANLLHAIGTINCGLPRRSHFDINNSQIEDQIDLDTRLEAFAKHPCVALALSQQSSLHVSTVTKSKDVVTVSAKQQRLVPFTFNITKPRVQFLASIMEIEAFTQPHAPVPMSSWSNQEGENNSIEFNKVERTLLMRTMAASFFVAAGINYSPSIPGTEVIDSLGRVPSARTYHRDTDALNDFSRFSESIAANTDFMNLITDTIARRIFKGRMEADFGPDDVRTNTAAIISALTAAGITANPKDASIFVVDAVLGHTRIRRNMGLPKADTATAFAFIETINQAGGFGDSESGRIENTSKTVVSFPDYAIPYRDTWRQALFSFGTDRVMRTVISRVRAESRAENAGFNAQLDSLKNSDSIKPLDSLGNTVDTATRRRRVSI